MGDNPAIFTNEFGNSIVATVVDEPIGADGVEHTVPGVRIRMAGPTSAVDHHYTRAEAEVIHRLLGRYLGKDSEKFARHHIFGVRPLRERLPFYGMVRVVYFGEDRGFVDATDADGEYRRAHLTPVGWEEMQESLHQVLTKPESAQAWTPIDPMIPHGVLAHVRTATFMTSRATVMSVPWGITPRPLAAIQTIVEFKSITGREFAEKLLADLSVFKADPLVL